MPRDEADQTLRANLAFTLAAEEHTVPLARLQERFGSIPAAHAAGWARLREHLQADLLRYLRSARCEQAVQAELEQARGLGLHLLPEGTPAYPPALAHYPGRPPVLYVRGNPERVRDLCSVAVVGTRHCTEAGLAVARRLGRDLARAGVVVVSGLAYGIDAAAQGGALEARERPGQTVAVLAGSVMRISPAGNRALGERILAEGGALVCEGPLHARVSRASFPRRNRIIAGLTLGVVVVEAPERSGAGITARQAGDQGREVMAVPGPVDLEAAEGCNALIRDGAALVRHARDVLETVPALRELADESIPPWTPPDPTSRAGRIVAALRQGGGGSLDQLCRHTGLPTIELLPCLTELEQAGVLQRQAGLYRLA